MRCSAKLKLFLTSATSVRLLRPLIYILISVLVTYRRLYRVTRLGPIWGRAVYKSERKEPEIVDRDRSRSVCCCKLCLFAYVIDAWLSCLDGHYIEMSSQRYSPYIAARRPTSILAWRFGLCNCAINAAKHASSNLYMGPEMCQEKDQTHKVDVWSLFVTMS